MKLLLAVKRSPLLYRLFEELAVFVRADLLCLFEESFSEERDHFPKIVLGDCEVCSLSPSDIQALLIDPEVSETEKKQMKRMIHYCVCFGMKHNGRVVAYTWANLKEGPSIIPPLGKEEAYLFDAHTFTAYRGKNIAPYLRCQMYRHLNQVGRTKFYSQSNRFNTAAMRFKKKLSARPLKLYLRLRFFKRYNWNMVLKRYA